MMIFEEPEIDRPLNLLPCANCGKEKVLKPGDYCMTCALKWPRVDEYFIVDPNTLDDVAEVCGISHAYLKAKQEAAFEKTCKYVIFYAQKKWQEVLIAEQFNVALVMKNLIRKLDANE